MEAVAAQVQGGQVPGGDLDVAVQVLGRIECTYAAALAISAVNLSASARFWAEFLGEALLIGDRLGDVDDLADGHIDIAVGAA